MDKQNMPHPSQGSTYSTASNAGKPSSEKQTSNEERLNKKPMPAPINEEIEDIDQEQTQTKDWK
jgi:hypothetical protein